MNNAIGLRIGAELIFNIQNKYPTNKPPEDERLTAEDMTHGRATVER